MYNENASLKLVSIKQKFGTKFTTEAVPEPSSSGSMVTKRPSKPQTLDRQCYPRISMKTGSIGGQSIGQFI